MNHRLGLFAAALLLLSPVMPRAADELQLQKSVRVLASLQDRTASGDNEAARLQSRLIAQIESDIRLAPGEVLRDPRNLQALAVLLLSGANPNLVEAQTLNLPMDENMRNLISGSLAYARADRDGASKLLAKVDVGHLPPSLAGRVALVRSIIGVGDNPLRSIDDLYRARELMPGTLVEEASLRRCVSFAGRLADKERLRFCSGRYIRRFPHSLYFQEFEESFANAVAQSGFGAGEEFGEIMDNLARLSTPERRRFLLLLARTALTHGRHQLAAGFAENARDLALAGSGDMARAKLYLAAAALAGDKFSEEAAKLAAIDPAALPEADAKLLADARRLVQQIEEGPGIPLDKARQIAFTAGPAEKNEALEKSIAAARAAIRHAERLVPISSQQDVP
jgi:chemotaxis protein MotC